MASNIRKLLLDTKAAPSSSLFGPEPARDALCREADWYVARATLMMRRARLLVLDDRVDCTTLLTARRGSLGEHFRRYQRFKHGMIFDPVVQHGRPSSKVVARSMKVDCMALAEHFSAYQIRWHRVCQSDWLFYRADMLCTTDSMATHLDAELRAIRQLLMISEFYNG